jgi:hypothetical protein
MIPLALIKSLVDYLQLALTALLALTVLTPSHGYLLTFAAPIGYLHALIVLIGYSSFFAALDVCSL